MILNKVLGVIFLFLSYFVIKNGIKHKTEDSWDVLNKTRSFIVGTLLIITGLYLIFTSE